MKVECFNASAQTICYDAKDADDGLLKDSRYEGYYLLKDGTRSFDTVYNQEAGVFADDNLYLPLSVMAKPAFGAGEAKDYFSGIGEEVPDLYEIVRLKLTCGRVNDSLEKIGMGGYALPKNILAKVWYKEALEDAKPSEKRRCVVIKHYGDYTEPVYSLPDNDCLLFDNSLVYARTADCFEPVRMSLICSWEGFDFLSAEIGGASYNFYRGKDLKPVFLGKRTSDAAASVKVYSNELIGIEQDSELKVYQKLNGKLLFTGIKGYNTCVSRIWVAAKEDKIEVTYSDFNYTYLEDIENTLTYRKNENGLYVYAGE